MLSYLKFDFKWQILGSIVWALHKDKCLINAFFWFDLCVQVQHQNLKSAHSQLALTLEDHKSALAAAQVRRQQQ